MSESWKKSALKIGNIIRNASKLYPQLIPLHTSWMNFAQKYQVQQTICGDTFLALLEVHELRIIPIVDFDSLATKVKRQDEEIKALEYRIATLLRPEP